MLLDQGMLGEWSTLLLLTTGIDPQARLDGTTFGILPPYEEFPSAVLEAMIAE